MKQDALVAPINTDSSLSLSFWSSSVSRRSSAARPDYTARVKAGRQNRKAAASEPISLTFTNTHAALWKWKIITHCIICAYTVSQMNLFCLANTVPVPEEYQDFPGRVQRGIRHEEKRAVRGLWPFWRQGLWKGKAALLGDTERDGGSRFLVTTACIHPVCVCRLSPEQTELNYSNVLLRPLSSLCGRYGTYSKLFISGRAPLSWTCILMKVLVLASRVCAPFLQRFIQAWPFLIFG